MELVDIIKKLVGPINPVGKTEVDNERFENLKELCETVNLLIGEIDAVAYNNKDAYEYSIKRSVDYVNNFLTKEIGIPE